LIFKTESRSNSTLFGALAKELLAANLGVRFRAQGRSMAPAIADEEFVYVQPAAPETLGCGDVVLFSYGEHFRAHRIVKSGRSSRVFVTQGDSSMQADAAVFPQQIMGKIVAVEDAASGRLRCVSQPVRHSIGARAFRAAERLGRRAFAFCGVLGLLLLVLSLNAAAQVVADTANSNSGIAELTSATKIFTFTHTVPATLSNPYLLVGVSMNIENNTAAVIAANGVTYNGTALTFIGAHNDSTNKMRVEMWGLVNPLAGSGLTLSVTASIAGAGTVGVVAGATNFSGVNQSQPLMPGQTYGSYNYADGGAAGGTASSLTINSETNALPVDIVAAQATATHGSVTTITAGGAETALWNASSGADLYSVDPNGLGGLWAEAATVTMSETFWRGGGLTASTSYWSQIGVSIQPALLAAVVNSTTSSVTFSQTVPSSCTNCYLVVGVSMNISAATGTNVSGITYNGQALTQIGATNDNPTTPSYRVEQWGLLAPPAGTHNVVVSFANTTASNVGVIASAQYFSGVDQYQPTALPPTYANTYANSVSTPVPYDYIDVPSEVTATVVDTLATSGSVTISAGSGETTIWSETSAVANLSASGSTHVGTTLTDLYDNLSGSSTWALMGTSLNPPQTDVGVSLASSGTVTYPCASCITYTATVTNYGPDPASGVTLAESLSASGLTVVSITPSTGSCSGAYPTFSCSLGTMAVNATATVTIIATPTASGGYLNTATLSGISPTDYNTTNNSSTALASAEVISCTGVTTPPPANTPLTGVLDTYYPGAASAAAGATSLSLGTPRGYTTTGVAVGDLLLVIQMQGASINSSNTSAYGNGANGAGYTAINNVGVYEYVTATSALGAGATGAVTIKGAGAGGGLMYSYTKAAASSTAGQSTFQVIDVPEYANATLGSGLTAPPWNGSTGGVLAVNVDGVFNLNGGTATVSGLGFRGGAGMEMDGVAGGGTYGNPCTPSSTVPCPGDYVFTTPTTYTQQTDASGETTTVTGAHATKGEGIAGTPGWLQQYGNVTNAGTPVYAFPGTVSGDPGYISGGAIPWPGGTVSTGVVATGTDYPYSTVGTATGSMGRGAPGNAGGGGADADPVNNDHNSGGGGGGNGGAGGGGGDSWESDVGIGGLGGSNVPATLNRVAMGGGGGSGTRNNDSGMGATQVGWTANVYASAGAPGGGMIMVVAGSLTGTGTFYADGVSAYSCNPYPSGYVATCNGTYNDAGGGGGAGGSIVILSQNGGESGLTLSAQGGAGGSAWANDGNATLTLADRHGPGGGGGGGVVLVSGTPASSTVSGGGHSWTNNSSEGGPYQYGATNGGTGIVQTNASPLQLSGIPGGALCLPDMTSAAVHTGTLSYGSTLIRGLTGTLTMTATNAGPYGPTTGPVTLTDLVPAGLTPIVASGAGWSCSLAGQEVSCICPSCLLAPAATSNPVNITVDVSQTAAATLTNQVTAGGGGAANTANDNSSDSLNLASVADLSVSDSVSSNEVTAGSNIIYTQTVANNGPSDATNATFTEAIPAGIGFVSISAPTGWSCSSLLPGTTNATITCTDPDFTVGSPAPFSLVVNVPPGTAGGKTIPNTVSVSSGVSDPNLANNTASITATVGSTTAAALLVTDSVSPTVVQPSGTLTYSPVVSNIGGLTTTAVTFAEKIPANTTFVSMTPPAIGGVTWSGSNCTTPLSGTITCTSSGGLAAGYSGTFALKVTANAGTAIGTQLSDLASATATTGGTSTASATATVAATSGASLLVTDSVSPTSQAPSGNITFYPVVANVGGAATSAATFTETLPATTVATWVSTTAANGWLCGAPSGVTITCTNPSVAAGSSATFAFVVTVKAGTANGTFLTDGASATATTGGTSSASATATVETSASADLAVVTTAPATVQPSNTILYTNTVTNNGYSPSTVATLTLPIPANTTFLSYAPPAGWTCSHPSSVVCTATSPMAANTSVTIPITVTVSSGATGSITAMATVSATVTPDPIGGNNTSTAVTTILSGAATLGLSTTAPTSVNAGNNITYANIVTNSGPGATSSTTLTVPMPASTTFQSYAPPAGWTCIYVSSPSEVLCTDSSGMAPGANVTIPVTVSTPPTAAPGTVFTASPSVTAATGGTANSSASTTVNPSVDLVVTDTAVQTAATSIAYTQTVTNIGPSTTGAITLTQYVPASTAVAYTSVPSGWSCVPTLGTTYSCISTPILGAGGSATCTNVIAGTTTPLASNASVSFGMTLSGAGVTGTVCEWGGATTNYETYPPDNLAFASATVQPAVDADVAVSVVGAPASGLNLYPGSNVVENFTISNNGPATVTYASATTFTFAISGTTSAANDWISDATFYSIAPPANWTCTTPAVGATGAITCHLNSGTMAPGVSVIIPVTLKVNATTVSLGGTTNLTVYGTVATTYTDPVAGNNNASASTPVAALADLAWTTSTATPGEQTAGSNITYSLILTNNGPSDSQNVTVTDTLPANTTFVSMTTPAGWACADPAVGSAGTITCTIADLTEGATATFNPVFKITAGTTATPISNTIRVSSSTTTDPNLANNSASDTTPISITGDVDLGVTNTPSAASVQASNNISYTQVFTNYGGATSPAAAGSVTFTETIPPDTTFVSFTPTAGLTCIPTPTVGTTGTFSCTNNLNTQIASGGVATFVLVVQVNPGTPDGTVINDTTSISTTATDPNLANNTATATVKVVDPNTASVGIGMTGSTAVLAGNNATYTITVTNSSATVSATNVTVTDVIPELATDGTSPTELTYVTATPSVGTCSQASGTVTCELGTMTPLATATITLVTATAIPTTYINPASVVADQQTTPQTTSVQTLVSAPTDVRLKSFVAGFSGDNVVLEWKTGGELHNLGFNVYREVNDTRVRLNSSLIAGSALRMRGALEQHAASSYSWIDRTPQSGAVYWIEDVDVHGARVLHGPLLPQSNAVLTGLPQARTLSQLQVREQGMTVSVDASSGSQLQSFAPLSSTPWQNATQNQLASGPATKIAVDHEGWYSVNLSSSAIKQTAVAAPARHYYHLYAEGIEQPIHITGQMASSGGDLEFYGTGIDTPYTGTRVYWLVENSTPQDEIGQTAAPANSGALPQSFPYTVELKQRTTYFSTLMTPGNHFFGDAVASDPATTETLTVTNLAKDAPAPVITVVLRGAIDQTEHEVFVAVNNVGVGVVNFYGMDQGTLQVQLPPNVLKEGTNTVLLNALNGENDVSLLDHIDLQYGHTYTAESDALKFTAASGEHVTVSGFKQKPSRLIDITNPAAPIELTGSTIANGTGFALDFAVPRTLLGTRTLLAAAADTISAPQGTTYTAGSNWNAPQSGSDVVMISDPAFVPALNPLVNLHRNQGHSVAVVPIGDIYDEFNYGENDPIAIKEFLQAATVRWHNKPRYLLLVGDASVDPRDYLGMGSLDFVPTAIIPTAELMTASDDWFSDFSNSGLAQISTGRLPVVTAAQASLVVNKIVGYQSSSASFSKQVLFVADQDDTDSFTQETKSVQALLPSSLSPTNILETLVGSAAPQEIVNAINNGPLLVNYIGHGSEAQWSNGDLFDNDAAAALTNGNKLPVFLMMACFNGFFDDVYQPSLAATVLESANGGGVAVWASSGLLDPAPQVEMDRQLWRALIAKPSPPLGDAIAKAKASITDLDTRRTYILFGDPLLQVRLPK
jgi:uncharacterized repeat protein (TIGR01451 family)